MAAASIEAQAAWEAANTRRLLAKALPAVVPAFAAERCVMAVTVELDMGVLDYVCQVTIWRRGVPTRPRRGRAPAVRERFGWKVVEYEGATWGKDPEWADQPDWEGLFTVYDDPAERPERERDAPRIGPKRGFATPEAALRDAIADRHDGLGTLDEADLAGAPPCS